jgi:alkylhydroperoxidase family enzyme
MARVGYVEGAEGPDGAALVERIRAGRRGELLNIYRLLLHSPPLAQSWFDHFNAVRWRTRLPGRLRELVIIRIAHLHRMAYVLRQHVPKLALADGVSVAECDALADWPPSPFFDARERAALAHADEMVRTGTVADATFDGLRAHFDEQAIVELTVLIGSYIMHNRVFAALQIDLEPPAS